GGEGEGEGEVAAGTVLERSEQEPTHSETVPTLHTHLPSRACWTTGPMICNAPSSCGGVAGKTFPLWWRNITACTSPSPEPFFRRPPEHPKHPKRQQSRIGCPD